MPPPGIEPRSIRPQPIVLKPLHYRGIYKNIIYATLWEWEHSELNLYNTEANIIFLHCGPKYNIINIWIILRDFYALANFSFKETFVNWIVLIIL